MREDENMSTASLKATVRRYFEEALDKTNLHYGVKSAFDFIGDLR